MKIVIIDKEEGYKVGGVTVYNHRLYNYLISKNYQAFILRFAKRKPKEKYIFHLPYYLAEPRFFIILPSERTLSIIKKQLKKIKPDIVYTSVGLSPLDFFLPSLCHELNIPIAGIWHADFNYSLSSIQLLTKSLFLAYLPFVKQLNLLHVFSQKLANFYISRRIDKGKILVLPNGVNQNFYTTGKSDFARRFGIKKGILFLGRLTLQKNPEVLLASFLKLDPPKDTKLILIGHGELEEELREKYQDSRIIFTGVVKDEKRKRDIMRACQLSVLPSRAEGMPLALLEAMSCGLACIASDAGANHDLLKGAGVVIPSTKLKQELPISLRLCLDYPEFTRLLGKKARQKIISKYSQDIIFKQLVSSFTRTISCYRKRGFPETKPIDINREIIKKLVTLRKRFEQVLS